MLVKKSFSPKKYFTFKWFKFQQYPYAKQSDGNDKKNGNSENDKVKKDGKGKGTKDKEHEDEHDQALIENNYVSFQGLSRSLEQKNIFGNNSTKWSDESFVINLYRGNMQPSQVFPFPQNLKPEKIQEVDAVIKPLDHILQNVNNSSYNDSYEKIPKKVYEELKQIGLLRLNIPKSYGGLGFSYLQIVRCQQRIGMYDLNLAGFLSGHQGLGYKSIELFGTPYQREKYLTMIAKENKVAAFALFETMAESDISAIRSRAKLDKSKKYYILNGTKKNVINGGIADIFTVLALTRSEDDELNARVFIVEKSYAGVFPGSSTNRMGMRGMNSTKVEFKNVKVPVENIVGKDINGHLMAMQILNHCRYGISAYLSGTLKAVLHKTVQFLSDSNSNRKGIVPIVKKMGVLTVSQYVIESLALMISGNMDKGFKDLFVEAAITKCYSSNRAFKSVDNIIQVFGNKGYERATGLECVLRNIRFYRLFSGTNDMLRLFISLMGIQYASIDYQDIQTAFNNPRYNLGLVFGRPTPLGLPPPTVANLRLTVAHLVHPSLHAAAARATKSILFFGQVVQLLMERHGREVIEDQKNLIALSDAAIHIYTMIVAMSRCSSALYRELPSANSELIIVESFTMSASSYVHNILEKLESKTQRNVQNRVSFMIQHLIKGGRGFNPKFNARPTDI